ncbi:hypothetical protein RHSIM_Rhsim12G0055400 [Rhododendron simsii]|uniref:No apical meristem-associated C-terminal domain-containing protein n=1 Tax=Rhododendron simsii TaxID=118357 RepID=A0A834G2R1_RHOSS|nr:hypothetical protein RHSIM_Rhsim12G0055400 [Rhododendron simsii]
MSSVANALFFCTFSLASYLSSFIVTIVHRVTGGGSRSNWLMNNINAGGTTERNSQGLQNRWQIISHDVSKFCGHYNKIGRLNRSGWNDQMIIDEAKQQFRQIEGPLQAKPVQFYKFKYEHCWQILKDSSKWNNHVLAQNTNKVSKKSSNPQSQAIGLDDMGSPPLSTPLSPSPPGSTPLGEAISLDDAHNQLRPEGRQKTKAKRNNEGKDDESTLYLKSINETLKDAAVIEKEKLEAKKSFEKEKQEAKKRRIEQKAMHEERKVMSQSLVGLTPEQVTYWKLQQSIIIERYKANGLMQDPESYGNVLDFDF